MKTENKSIDPMINIWVSRSFQSKSLGHSFVSKISGNTNFAQTNLGQNHSSLPLLAVWSRTWLCFQRSFGPTWLKESFSACLSLHSELSRYISIWLDLRFVPLYTKAFTPVVSESKSTAALKVPTLTDTFQLSLKLGWKERAIVVAWGVACGKSTAIFKCTEQVDLTE